jgi:hypothetical protein
LVELKLYPKNSSTLIEMYETFSKGALLNPDEDDDAEEELIFNAMEVHKNLKLQNPPRDEDDGEMELSDEPPLKK